MNTWLDTLLFPGILMIDGSCIREDLFSREDVRISLSLSLSVLWNDLYRMANY